MAAESRFRAGAPPVPNRIHVRCRKCKEIIDLGFEGLGYAEAVKTSRRNVRISHRVSDRRQVESRSRFVKKSVGSTAALAQLSHSA
jgi:hypothetical protein